MVKQNKLLIFIILGFSCLSISCNVDLLGLFASSQLDDRLGSKDNFVFLADANYPDQLTPSFGSGDYSFIVITDTHIEDGKVWGLEKLIDVIQSNSNIKFVVFLGDITQNGSSADIDRFIGIANDIRDLGVHCYPVIGNHDIYFGNWKVWDEKIGSTSYRIDADRATLFILDSANSYFGKKQLDWLENEIKVTRAHTFVFTHSSLFVPGFAAFQRITDTRERSRMMSILRNKCDIMFMGHSHKRAFNEAGNVRYITIEDFKGTSVYCLVTVTSSGIIYKFEKL